MNTVDFKEVGFVYKFWYRLFIFIEIILPFSILRKFVFKKTKQFSDKWVVFNFILSLFTLLIIHYHINFTFKNYLLIYSTIRIFEIVIYQINVLLFHPYKTLVVQKKSVYKIANPFRSVVLLGHNLVEVVFWFTAMMSSVYPSSDRLAMKLIDNTVRIFTLSYERVVSEGQVVQLIFFFEVLCGLLLTIISLAKFIGELPHIHLKNEQK